MGAQTELLAEVSDIARRAGAAILEIYGGDFAVREKSDSSPVTSADERAEALIVSALHALTPDTPVVSEEAAALAQPTAAARRFWLVDPLDGTREFVSRNGEFTVNIALVEDDRPSLGVVFAPALDRLFAGATNAGAFAAERGERRAIQCRRPPAEGLTVVSSRSHSDQASLAQFLRGRRVASSLIAGSSLKFCLVACGAADLYPRLGRTMEWDTAAGHAILSAVGGRVVQTSGEELTYGKQRFENPHFVAMGLGPS